MPRAQRSRVVAGDPHQIWELIADPHHMPRWWPGVARMEEVQPDRFTQVFKTKKGRPVRIDYRVTESNPPRARAWAQEIAGTPFEHVLHESVIDVRLEPVDEGTRVTLGQRQKLRGFSRSGGFLLKRATSSKLDEALDGLERIWG